MLKKVEKRFLIFEIIASELVKLKSLLIREYLSSAVNVLTNTRKILYINKRDFFRLNYLQTEQ